MSSTDMNDPSNNKRKGLETSKSVSAVDSSSGTDAKKMKPNENSSSSSASAQVLFNVGGTHYEVSRSLLAQHPNSMLARMVSEEWSGSDNTRSGNEPLFIDRNGFRFQYILDYMRDGEVSLPPELVSMDAVMKDLLYFGFEDVPEKAVTVASNSVGAMEYLLSFDGKHQRMENACNERIDQLKKEKTLLEGKEAAMIARHRNESSEQTQRHNAEKKELAQRQETEKTQLAHRQETEKHKFKQRKEGERKVKDAAITAQENKKVWNRRAFNIFKHYRRSGKVDSVVSETGNLDTSHSCFLSLQAFIDASAEGKENFGESLAAFGLKVEKVQLHEQFFRGDYNYSIKYKLGKI